MSIYKNTKLNRLRNVWIKGNIESRSELEQSILLKSAYIKTDEIERVFEKLYEETDESIDYYSLIVAVSSLGSNFKSFMSIPRGKARSILKDSRNFEAWEMRSYIKASILRESVDPLMARNSQSNEERFSAALKAYVSLSSQSIDLRIPHMLKDVYGIKAMTELLDKAAKEKSKITFDLLIDLLKNWDEVKDYPLEWSIEVMSGK